LGGLLPPSPQKSRKLKTNHSDLREPETAGGLWCIKLYFRNPRDKELNGKNSSIRGRGSKGEGRCAKNKGGALP